MIMFEVIVDVFCNVATAGEELVALLGENPRPHEHPRYKIPVAGNIVFVCYRSSISHSGLLILLKNTLFQDDAIEHVDMEEEVSNDIEEAKPGTTPDLDEGDEVNFGVFAVKAKRRKHSVTPQLQ